MHSCNSNQHCKKEQKIAKTTKGKKVNLLYVMLLMHSPL